MAYRNLTQTEWVELGRWTKKVRSDVLELSTEINNKFPAKTRHCRKICAAMKAIESARSELEEEAYRQHRNWPDITHVFYGQRDPVEGTDNG